VKRTNALSAFGSLFLIGTLSVAPAAVAVNTFAEAYRAEGARLYALGELEKANRLYEQAFNETEPIRGGKKVTLEQSYILSEWGLVEQKLAEAYGTKAEAGAAWLAETQRGYLASAVGHLETAVDTQESLLGSNNAVCARSLDTLAAVRAAQNDFPKAESLFRKGLAIRETNGEGTSAEAGYELWQIAKVTCNDSRYKETTELCHQAIPILDKAYGAHNNASMQCTYTLAEAMYHLKKYNEAENLADTCFSFWKAKRGLDYSLTKQSDGLLKDSRSKLADKAQDDLRQQLNKISPGDSRLAPFIESWRTACANAGRTDDVAQAGQWLAGMVSKGKTARNGKK
jgi:Tetratricopeptide repeat